MKVFISADMEGVAGVVNAQQLGPEGFEYEKFRELMTAEVSTAIEAAREAGARQVVVADSHGSGLNLLVDKLPDDIQLVRSWPRPLMMVEGIDETFDALIFIGYHTATHNPAGVRAHTISSAIFAELSLNGRPLPECGLNSAIAGHFGVPPVMLSGDDQAVREAQELLGPIEGAVVKWACGFHSARTLMPQAARREIARKVKAALGRLDDFKPFVVQPPITLTIRFKNYLPSEVLSYLPSVTRTDSRTIEFTADDMIAVSKFIQFVITFRPDLAP